MKLTAEQEAGLEAFATGENIVFNAGAGCGKTFMLKTMGWNTNDKGKLIAYNKSIADEAARTFPRNVRCQTAHSMAFGVTGKLYVDRLNIRHYSNQTAGMLNLRGGIKIGELAGEDVYLSANKQANLCREMIQRWCYTTNPELTIYHMPQVEGIGHDDKDAHFELARHLLPYAQKLLKDLINPKGIIGWNKLHDLYLKLWALTNPIIHADFIQYDEAQDANPCMAGVVLAQKDAQLIAVGDQCQAIYEWRGSKDAMQKWPAAHRLTLSKSFRFGPAIAEEANKWLELLDAPLRLTGFEEIDSRLGVLVDADAVLCRTNATVIAEAINALENDRNYHIAGGTAEIERMARAVQELQQRGSTEHPDLMAFKSWDQVREFVEEGGSDLKLLVKLVDAHGVEVIHNVARNAKAKEQDAELVLSTAHKAKGREWKRVRIAADFNDPTIPDPETGEQREFNRSEGMLAYVSVTRAQEVLDREGLAFVDKLLHPKSEYTTVDSSFLDAPVAVKQGVIAKGRRKKKEAA